MYSFAVQATTLFPIGPHLSQMTGRVVVALDMGGEREEKRKLTLASVSCTELFPTLPKQGVETELQFSFPRQQQVSLHVQQYAFRKCIFSMHSNEL